MIRIYNDEDIEKEVSDNRNTTKTSMIEEDKEQEEVSNEIF